MSSNNQLCETENVPDYLENMKTLLKLDGVSDKASIIDPFDHLKIVKNSDGTITRLLEFPEAPPTPDLNCATEVLSKDITVNPSNNTWVRVYLPREALVSPTINKLPLILYLHGGGFAFLSAGSKITHDHCFQMALELTAIVVSMEYRLTPEHKLPAAYDDTFEALHWLKTSDEEWLRKYGDYSKCFIVGNSAGGNIAYHVGLRAAAAAADLEPLKIKGLMLQHPFFGGVERSESELRSVNDMILPLSVTDLMWDFSLPIGADRDHEYSNPTVGDGSNGLNKIRSLNWTVVILVSDGDVLFDRQRAFGKLMKEKGIQVVEYFRGGYHGDVMEPAKATEFFKFMKTLI